ncbi:PQQ-dependent catabolism-associated CXXCW motif protein [Azospirillum sp.]|uniref:PQQ-dependent catabolism-associated CXXCW motif protein n=1 Tax=Azospirillum sp. TaxID=34012 RepID=UPI003D70E2CA
MRGSFWAAMAAMVLLTLPARAGGPVTEPAGYRLDGYRAPTPATLAGATTVDTAAARRLVEEGAALPVNVLKLERRPAGPWLLAKPTPQIPGGVWLPNVGLGEPGPEIEAYMVHALERLTGGDRGRGLLFYCLADCWMSWNAAKRALFLGYRRVYWYRDGLDGWEEAGLPTQDGGPLPLSAGP